MIDERLADALSRADRMANDWFEFCEAMGVTPDTQEAVAYTINARIHNAEYTARKTIDALVAALEGILEDKYCKPVLGSLGLRARDALALARGGK